MIALTGEQLKRKADLCRRLEKAKSNVESKIDDLNSAIQDGMSDVDAAVREYNDIAEEACDFTSEVAAENQEKWENRDEEWQESERGQKVSDWIGEWENAGFDVEVEVPDPDEVCYPDMEAKDTLDNLPDEPEKE